MCCFLLVDILLTFELCCSRMYELNSFVKSGCLLKHKICALSNRRREPSKFSMPSLLPCGYGIASSTTQVIPLTLQEPAYLLQLPNTMLLEVLLRCISVCKCECHFGQVSELCYHILYNISRFLEIKLLIPSAMLVLYAVDFQHTNLNLNIEALLKRQQGVCVFAMELLLKRTAAG